MGYNYQDSKMESQQEYFGKVRTDNTKTLQNALKRIEELEAQVEKMKNWKVFLLQIVDADDYTIDRRFYTTDEEIAKEWDKYDKYNCCFGQAIELEELSDKERIREELND